MRTRQRFVPAGFALLACVSAAVSLPGCGKEEPAMYPVEGKVMLGDKVLATDAQTDGYVTLKPDKKKGNNSLHEPRGTIDSEGKFTIKTGLKVGAEPGWYIVITELSRKVDPKSPYVERGLTPERYSRPESS